MPPRRRLPLPPAWVPLLLLPLGSVACGPKAHPAPEQTVSVEETLAHLEEQRRVATSFRGESVMDYWIGRDRVKGTVWVMGKQGARLRFNALNPDAGTTAVDLACDGTGFQYINYHENCQLTGPCTRDAVRTLLGVSLEPDDFLLLAVGSAPLVGPDPQGDIRWDGERGGWEVTLVTSDHQWRQTLLLSHPELEVRESMALDARGEVEWKLTNADFTEIVGEGERRFRVPERTRFEKPKENADLIVRWRQRDINLELSQAQFEMEIPAGLPECS